MFDSAQTKEELLEEMKSYPVVMLGAEVRQILRWEERKFRDRINHKHKIFWKDRIVDERPKKFLKTDVAEYLLFLRRSPK